MDYGIISLLLIQLFVAIGCLFSWNSIRVESNGIKAAFLEQKSQLDAMGRIVEAGRVSVSHFETRLQRTEEAGSEAVAARQIAEEARKTAQGAQSEVEDVERSMKARFAAVGRWNKPKPEEEDDDDDVPPVIHEDLLPTPNRPYSPLQERALANTFGKSAV